jgi:putative hydrolase of the HAD superfamily
VGACANAGVARIYAHAGAVRALIFDFDGLIIDSERVLAECIIEAVAEHGTTITYDDIGHLFGTTEADHVWDELLAVWCEGRMNLAALEAAVTPLVRERTNALPLLPGVADLIDAAHGSGWRVGLGTGSSRRHVEPRLERHGVLHRFDAIVTRAEVERGKPDPDIYLAVADRLGVAPPHCVVLEDSVPGCEAALAAGMRVIACPSAVSAGLTYPPGARRVVTLAEVTLADL